MKDFLSGGGAMRQRDAAARCGGGRPEFTSETFSAGSVVSSQHTAR